MHRLSQIRFHSVVNIKCIYNINSILLILLSSWTYPKGELKVFTTPNLHFHIKLSNTFEVSCVYSKYST